MEYDALHDVRRRRNVFTAYPKAKPSSRGLTRGGLRAPVARSGTHTDAAGIGSPQPIDGFQEQTMTPISQYSRFSQWFAQTSGRPVAFILALGLIIAWILIGPVFHFSDTWQLVMNTISSIVTFLMVFAIQNTQNRQTDALQIKLDELIRATHGAHNALLDLEELEDTQLMTFRDRYTTLAHKAREDLKRGLPDTDTKDT
jgi:low affinity Fe/Cu permease